jgi:hypothetical protein
MHVQLLAFEGRTIWLGKINIQTPEIEGSRARHAAPVGMWMWNLEAQTLWRD